ncbi:MAG: hypothetical protein ACK5Q5_11260 [Planctomycetaceae bacterium]
MAITFDLPTELEAKLRQLTTARGQSVEEALCRIVADEITYASELDDRPKQTTEEVMAAMDRIAHRTPRTGGRLDDSRESIYEGCGE